MMQRISMIGSALSQLGNVMTAVDLTDTGPNESLSARMHRQRGVGTELTGSSHGMRRTTANVHGKMRLTQRAKPWTVRARHIANRGGMTEMIRTWWPVAVTVIAAIVWLIRLEARGISNGAEIRRLWSQRKEDMEAVKDSRDRMDRRLDEIGSDIKTLLRGMGK